MIVTTSERQIASVASSPSRVPTSPARQAGGVPSMILRYPPPPRPGLPNGLPWPAACDRLCWWRLLASLGCEGHLPSERR